MTTNNTQQIVFIDSRVPDIQDLIDGVQPGVQVFVLDSGSDGVQQIADILAANDLHDLSSISIVSHGADGEVLLGATTLSESNLANHARALAEIGAALAPGGNIQLYGCDVAVGPSGQQFINDFSTFAGGAPVEAATHIVGGADSGGSWTLDFSSNNAAPSGTVASPFTSQALASFQGSLVAAPLDGQLWFVTEGGFTDTRIEFVNSNGTSQTIEVSNPASPSTLNPLGFPADIVFDPGAGLYFMSETPGATPDQGYGGNVLEGTLYSTAFPTTVYSVSSTVTTVSGTVHGLYGEQLAIDTTQHIVYLGIGSSNEHTQDGILQLAYNPTTGSITNNGFLITGSQTGINGPAGVFDIRDMALDTAHDKIYFVSMIPAPFAQNQIYVVDINSPTTVTTLFAQSLFPLNFSNGYILAVTVDTIHNQVYFATESQHPDATSTLNAIWEVSTAGGTPVKVANYPVGTFPNDLAFDESSRQLIISDQDNNQILFEQLDSTGLTITASSTITLTAPSVSSTPEGLDFDSLATLTGLVGTATQPTEQQSSVTLASGITLSDIDSPSLAGATVSLLGGSIANGTFTQFGGATGDVLSANTSGTNITASYNSSTETLILSGQDTFAHYALVLDRVAYLANGDNPTDYGSQMTRTIDWVVTDGLQNIPFGASNSASSTITVVGVNDAPTLATVASSAQYTEEGAFATLSGSLSIIDPDDLNLSSATVHISGGSFAGDTDVLAATPTGSVTVSYNTTTQTLLLTGTDTLAHYKSVLDSVTFHSGENPTNYGSNTTRTITWVAMDPGGTSIGGQDTSTLSTTTVTITNVNDAPTLALGTTVASWTEEGATTSLAPAATVSDPDNLKLTGATVQISGGFFAGDVLSATASGNITTGYNSSTGTLTLTGSDTLANYQTVLNTVTYHGGENPTDFGSDTTRTLAWTLNDGGTSFNISTAQTSTISVTFVNDAPTLTTIATTAQYTEEGSFTTLSSSISVIDVDDLNLSSATVSITGGSFAGDTDVLAATAIGNVTVSYNTSTQTLLLTGTDTLADYKSVLDSVTFHSGENPTNYGSNTTRTITWQVTDPSGTLNGGQNASSISTTTVTITNVNDAPTLALGTTVASWTEEGATTTLAPTASVTDPDNLNLSSATVQITGGTFAGDSDVLSATPTGNITVAYNSSTETLTLTGSDSLANYQTVLDSVTFHAGENPTDFGSFPTRTLTWTLNDGSASFATGTTTSTISLTKVNDAPTLAGVAASVLATPTQTVTLSSNVTISDADNNTMSSATVSITGGTFAGDGDVLTAEGTTNGTFVQSGHTITISYSSSTETLTLTGTDTLADYQNVLDTVAWHSTAGDPTNGGSNPTRTISWVVNDGDTSFQFSSAQTETLIIDTPPTLSGLNATASWTEEGAATTLSPAVTISDPDGVNTQLSATVKIVGGTFVGDSDVLSATPTGNISVNYDSSTETLTLTGSDSLANYQTVLDSVTFHAGENPTDFGSNATRTLAWTVTDHVGTPSAPVTTTVSITNVNDAPTLANVPASANFTEEGAAVTLASAASVTDPDDLKLVSATVQITGGTFAGDGDVLAATAVGTITVSYNSSTETLTLTGTDTLANYRTVLDSVTFNDGENPTNFGSNPTRTVTWTLNDGGGTLNGGAQVSTPVTSTISITNINDPPTLSNVAPSANFTEEGGPVTLSGAVSASDPDNLTLASATVKVNGGTFVGDGDVLSATGTSSITVSYNSSTETLTLSGTDTLAHYQSVLDTVTFNAGENPNNFGSNPIRTVTWTLNDGSASNSLSTVQTTTVSITNVNDAPTLSNVAASANYTEEGSAVTLASAASVSDPDNLKLVSATVKIVGGTFAGDGDVLAANVAGTSITASYNAATETMTLTGTDTLAQYQSVLDSITFSAGENPTNFGSNPTRTVTWQLNDGSASSSLSAVVTSTISITNVNDAPTLSNVAASANYTEEGAPVTLSGSVSITDPDDINLSGATVKITGGTFAGDADVLAASTTGTVITASYNSSTETLTLSGTDTLAHYQSVLDSVTFSAGENPNNYGSNPTRTLTWTLTDPGGTANGGVNVSTPVTSTVSVTNVNDQPTLTNVATLVGFVPQHTITISPAISVSDPDNLKLTNATVKITGGTFAGDGDVLAANVAGTSITASYNAATETLTLTGSDTLAHYQSVLDSVTFSSGINPSNGNLNRTRTVTWVINDGSASNSLSTTATTTISIGGNVRNDFDGDNKSDLLLQNQPFSGTPDVKVELLNGLSIASSATITTPLGWSVEATGDFNHDNKADIILQNNGLPQIWLMNGTSVTSSVTLLNPGPSWHVIATGDFNADGSADILWQNNDGAAAIWLMNDTTPIGGAVLSPNPGSSWHVIGAGDVNADGRADILWQNNDGTPAIWEMNGTSIIGGGLLINPGASWHAINLGDFNGDGKGDILWQNADGAAAIWELNGTSIIGGGLLSPNPGASWHVMGPSDFNGDGLADIVWQNADGTPAIWNMNGTTIIGGGLLPNPGPTWHVEDDGPISPDLMGNQVPPALHLSSPDPANPVPLRSAPDEPLRFDRNEVGGVPLGPDGLPSGLPPQGVDPGSRLAAFNDTDWMRQVHAVTG